MRNITTTQENKISQHIVAENMEKAPYQAPELIVHGRVEKLTLITGVDNSVQN